MTDEITIDDFNKLDLRGARIARAAKAPIRSAQIFIRSFSIDARSRDAVRLKRTSWICKLRRRTCCSLSGATFSATNSARAVKRCTFA